ncbi:MAG TPA: glycosyltransferase family 39 protein, partial [Verrucomicrobiae bacterium]|nr:glycosyltransferase family 39 protein [Verrucomicrobiae bacterium]
MQAEEISPGSTASPALAEKYLPSARQLFLILAIYFAAHVVIRSLVSNIGDMDETDQLVLTQKLSWGYGPQPPLYSWIQIGFFQIFGMGIFAIALWKFILLFTTHVLTYFNVRFVTRSHICAVAGVAALFLFHQFAWESVRDLSHSVLATTIAAGLLLTMMKLQEKRTIGSYLLLGICIGLGFLAKYNFVIVAGSLIMAGLTLPEYRRAILNPRILLTLIVAVLLVLPNVLWMLNHRDLLLVTAYKFRVHQGNWL